MSASPEPGVILNKPTAPLNRWTARHDEERARLLGATSVFFPSSVRPEKGEVTGLAKLALNIMRVESGDLIGIHGKRVMAYLDSARPKDLASLKIRMREHALRLGFGDIEIEALGFPANEDAVRDLLGAPAAS
jgi:hypothetical protein